MSKERKHKLASRCHSIVVSASVKTVLGLAAVLVSGQAAFADSPPDCRICVIDVQEIIGTSKAGVAASKQFKSRVEEVQADIQKRKVALQTSMKSLEKEASLLSKSALKKKRDAIRDEERALQDDLRFMQQDLKMGQQKALGSVVDEMKSTLASWKDKGYKGIVLEKDPRFVVYASNSIDVSEDVKEAMDDRYTPSKAR